MKLVRTRLHGLLGCALGTLGVLALLVGMNVQFEPPADDGAAGSAIEIVRPPPPPKSAPPPRRREPQPPRPRSNRVAPPAGIDGSLAGLDYGVPAFDAAGIDLGGSLLGDGADVVMTDDTVDTPPRPLLQTPMQYPARAKAAGITGYVLLNVLVGPTGQVEQVAVLESQPVGVFDEVAASAVRGWTFDPATYRGENVRVWARQKIRFDLAGA